MMTRDLHLRWLRLKRHLRSRDDRARAVHTAALLAGLPFRDCLCRRT